LRELLIDPEFRDKIPPLTEDEFKQLRENILSDGEVYEPIAVWNGTIIDGHNRWKVVQEHPEIPYRIKEMDFADKWEAFDWMYRKQLGRRNLTDEQRTVLMGKLYEARKKTHGASDGFRGNRFVSAQDGHLVKASTKTAEILAEELGVGHNTVKRAEKFANGIDTLTEVSPEAAQKVLGGASGAPKQLIRELPKMDKKSVQTVAEAIMSGEMKSKDTRTRHGWTKADRESRAKTDAIIADMMDASTVPEFTIDYLIEDIEANGMEYVSLLRNTLIDRSILLTTENKPSIAVAIEKIVSEIESVKGMVAA